MRPTVLIVTALTAITLVATACAPNSAPTSAPPAVVATQPAAAKSSGTQAPPEATPSGPAMVNVSTGSMGPYLVSGNGMTLYLLMKDSPGTSTCSGGCPSIWPPLLTAGTAQAGSGVDASKLGTLTRADGSTQVTYNGWPLYNYSKDTKPGDTIGEGFKTVWYIISPTGDALK